MSLNPRRTPKPDARPAGDERRATPVRPVAQLAARVGLWTAVAVGCLGGVIGVLKPTAAAPTMTTTQDENGPPAGVPGFAEEAVIAWLEATGDADDPAAALFVDAPEAPSVATTTAVRRTAAIAARPIEGGYWAVTVAAVVDEKDRGQATVSTATLYAEVGVLVGEAGATSAVGTPAIVAGPRSVSDGVSLAGPTPGVPTEDDPVAITAQGFLTALLTGSGDVSRYLAPGVEVSAVNPPPFSEVTIDRLAVSETDGRVRARVIARATTQGGGRRSLGYEVGIRQRAGRWEITSVSGAPALSDTGPAPAAEPSTAPPAPAESSTTTSFASEPGA